ncbi:MAG: GtrA family protein [Patescibacteria group bacterium]|jgi:putative flippase GtrA
MTIAQIRQLPVARQFVKFALVGFVNTAIDWTVFFSLTQWIPWFHEHILVANGIAFLFGFASSYTFNRRWTFRSKDGNIKRQLTVFLLVNLVGLGISETVVGVVHALTQSRLLSKFLAVALALFWNFFASRKWAFREGGGKPTVI